MSSKRASPSSIRRIVVGGNGTALAVGGEDVDRRRGDTRFRADAIAFGKFRGDEGGVGAGIDEEAPRAAAGPIRPR